MIEETTNVGQMSPMTSPAAQTMEGKNVYKNLHTPSPEAQDSENIKFHRNFTTTRKYIYIYIS